MPRRLVSAKNRAMTFTTVAILVSFLALAYSINRAHNTAVQSRRQICEKDNQTRAAVRQLVDLAFAPSLARAKDPTTRKAIQDFLVQVKAPVHNLPCEQIARGRE